MYELSIGFNAFDDSPWLLSLVEFTRKVLRQKRVKIIGVCFGHQIVGRAMNAKVARNNQGWEVSVCEVKLTGKGREVFGKDTLVCQPLTASADTIDLGHRTYTRCTKILYVTIQMMLKSWDHHQFATYKECTCLKE